MAAPLHCSGCVNVAPLQVCEELLATRSPHGAAVLLSIVSSCSAHLAGLTGSSSSSSDASGGGSGWMRGAVEVLGRLCPAVASYQGAQVLLQHSDIAWKILQRGLLSRVWCCQRWRGHAQLACAVLVLHKDWRCSQQGEGGELECTASFMQDHAAGTVHCQAMHVQHVLHNACQQCQDLQHAYVAERPCQCFPVRQSTP
jgi:hypothetical protein